MNARGKKEEWSEWRSDIEGKAVRVTASESGDERVSIKKEEAPRRKKEGSHYFICSAVAQDRLPTLPS